MCLECDGYSHEEAMQALDLRIRVHGWALVQVEDGPTHWCYTVGLLENFGHPELVLFDVRTESQYSLIAHLVQLITTHGDMPPAQLASMGLRCVDVHEDHLRSDLFGTWINRYDAYPAPGDMIHVRLPEEMYCSCHANTARRLDLPGPLPPLPQPNRAERRAERRRQQGRGHAA